MSFQQAIEFGLSKLGYHEIKDTQRKVIEEYVSGRDVLFVAPTGFGKSLTFQIAPFVFDFINGKTNTPGAICLVIAPLISLMKDQIIKLQGKGIKAVMIGPEASEDENARAKEGICNLIFASPECILGSQRKTIVSLRKRIAAVFIGESHCVAKWGHGSGTEEAFRGDYARLAEVRSILAAKTPYIALTATATEAVKKIIIRDLALQDCVQFISVPNKDNIRFSVVEIDAKNIPGAFEWLIARLRAEKEHTPKVLVFCRKRAHVKDLYEAFEEGLGDEGYVRPTGQEPRDDRTRLFAMYHKKTNRLVKEVVEQELCKENGTVRVVFCTIAFGMGVDVKGSYLAIHVGPSSNVDDYVQEVGRTGRNADHLSQAVLRKFSGCTRSKNISKEMKSFVKNTNKCRRHLLMKSFGGNESSVTCMENHSCCDVCARSCRCLCTCSGACSCSVLCCVGGFTPIEKIIAKKENCDSATNEEKTKHSQCAIDKATKSIIRDKLYKYRANLALGIPNEKLLTGIDIATGLSASLIEKIINNLGSVHSLETLKSLFSFFDEEHASNCWDIISTVLPSSSIQDSSTTPNPSNSDDTDDDSLSTESDDSDVFIRHRVCNVILESDSDEEN